jgi:predicted AAA+ superfamily ATPase
MYVDITTNFAVKLVVMFPRSLTPPRTAFFLFGPRGTGKSTWLRQRFPDAHVVDLLPPDRALEYGKDPALLRREVERLPRGRWVVLDEVQRAPLLLDQVHFLMESQGHKRFVLTGSSARKLRRGASNLLAGRAVLRRMHPLTAAETGHAVTAAQAMRFGLMPLSVTASSDAEREEYLQSYVTTYLAEEIKAEGLVRDAGTFARFLDVASLAAGQRVNMARLASDAQVSRETVRSYFSIFEDTLLGTWLPAYRPRAKVKEVAARKFYWFDSGVLHAAAGGFRQPLPADWNGVLLEHWIHHEIRAFLDYSRSRGEFGYWRTPGGSEVDFVWWYGDRIVSVEVKASHRFKPGFLAGTAALASGKTLRSSWLVYLGDRELTDGGVRILPVATFLRRLHRGDVLGT